MTQIKHMELSQQRKIYLAIFIAALGYFVDVYDLILFSVVRVASLTAIGIAPDALLSNGVFLLNMQMIGMLLGGLLWGIIGDKKGRIQVLFGSIFLYSIANIANAFVTTIDQYAFLRFIAGVGLAGEIGAGITLVSELMPKESRGYGTTIVATFGVLGAVVAGFWGGSFNWRLSYALGGIMGAVLLILRVSLSESGLFDSLRQRSNVACGDLKLLFRSKERILRYFCSIAIGIPTWFVVGVIVTFCPEIAKALNITEPVKVSTAVMITYIGITLGDLVSGLVSQWWKSRKKTILTFLVMIFVCVMLILNVRGGSAHTFYIMLAPLGFFSGYWAVFIATAAEQFGTNLRATVATTAPNFVRGMTVPITLLFTQLKGSVGILVSAQMVCVLVYGITLFALWNMKETFARDLDFIEEDRPEFAVSIEPVEENI